MSADIVHPGHIKIIKAGKALGGVTIGLLTDKAITDKKKRVPAMTYAERLEVIQNIKGIERVMPQESSDYRPNLIKLKPDYVVHGDDWEDEAKQQVVDTLQQWAGKLVELPYTQHISSTILRLRLKEL